MASTRDFKNPGIFAEDATTTIPVTPIQGVAYRDSATGADDTPNGWRYGTRVESQDWNQVMFLLTSMIAAMDSHGLLGWSDEVDYSMPALAYGSDGKFYEALQPSGPLTSPQDPVSSPAYWRIASIRTATNAEMLAGIVDDASATPASILAGVLGAGGDSSNDYITIPYRDKTTGVRKNLIVQWGVTANNVGGDNTSHAQLFPVTFPNAVFSVCIGTLTSLGSGVGSQRMAQLVSSNASGFTWFSDTFETTSSPIGINWIAIGH